MVWSTKKTKEHYVLGRGVRLLSREPACVVPLLVRERQVVPFMVHSPFGEGGEKQRGRQLDIFQGTLCSALNLKLVFCSPRQN